MRYEAIQPIGKYKIGDEVPAEQAVIWLEMYAIPHIKAIPESDSEKPKEDAESEPAPEAKDSPKEEAPVKPGSDMLEDYLGRNTKVVLKNIAGDSISRDDLIKLLKIEKEDKKRELVIKAIVERLKGDQ